jgi:hypothetical protein
MEDTIERTSYYDVLKQSLQKKQSRTSCMVIAASFVRDADRAEVTSSFQRLFRSIQSETVRITGVLLVFRHGYIHVVEAPSETIPLFLETVMDQVQTESTRVVGYVDDTERVFPFWASRMVEKEETGDATESMEELSITVVRNLMTMGGMLAQLSKVQGIQ